MIARRFILLFALASGCAHATLPPLPGPPRGAAGALVRPERVAYTPADELLATVSRDGRRIAYVTTESGNLDVVLRDLATGSVFPLTVAASDDFDPAFAPESDRLLFVSRRSDAKGDVFVMDQDGTSLSRLTSEDSADRQPVFSPDEKRVYFTRAELLQEEHIAVLDLDEEVSRTLSPTPGFDPAPSPDGRFLVYTAAPGVAGREHPHLVALRLTDGATRAITLGDSPAGFARFAVQTSTSATLVLVRFPDDDDADGSIDANDRASLWSVEVRLDALFSDVSGAVGPLVPLTAGTSDELFPWPASTWIYFTESAGNEQNVSRLPMAGMFPRQAPEAIDDPRERWFALRAEIAREGGEPAQRARLAIAALHLDADRPDLARLELEAVAADGELAALAAVGLIAIEREAGLARAAGDRERRAVLDASSSALDAISAATPRLEARIGLERAEIAAARGDRVGALAALDRLIDAHPDVSDVAGRALLRRTELLRIDFDPVAVTEAYGEVMRRYPSERGLVAEAARRIVDAWTASASDRGASGELEALRRALGRIELSWVRVAARRRIVERLRAAGDRDLVAVELAALAGDAEAAGDRSTAAQALGDLAINEESRGALPSALEAWTRLRDGYADLPGQGAVAREAITRVALANAAAAEREGRREAALALYRSVLENDRRQVTAHRRALALAAQAGQAEAMRAERKAARDAQPTDPLLRYAYALSLTYVEPPELSEALSELDEVLRRNPILAPAFIARGWVHEMLDTGTGRVELERAFLDYGRAVRLARDAQDPKLESEALLNLGNASWRVADRTNDAGNFYAAFRAYSDFLRLDGRLDRPETALVFWERLSRAASWSGEHATAAMAAREAIAQVEKLGRNGRLPQLYANLALTYTNASEPAYAEAAFRRFAETSGGALRPDRLAIAERNLALAKLDRLARTGEGDAESALDDLERSRARIPTAPFTASRPEGAIQAVVPDATRAPFGFDGSEELDLNLALSTQALRMQGDHARAASVEATRLALVETLVDDAAPLTLSLIREWLGLRVRALPCADAGEACRAAYDALVARLDELRADRALPADGPAIDLDRARLIALGAERSARLGALIRADLGTRIVDALDATEKLAAPDRRDLTATSSAALLLAGPLAMEAAAVHARLLHAQALLDLAGLRDPPPKKTVDLASALAELDRSAPALERSRQAFDRASRIARHAPTPLGGRIEALALHGMAEVASRTTGTATTASVAIDRARAFGGDGLAIGFAWSSSTAAGTALDELLLEPGPLPADDGLIDRAFVRALEAAIDRDDGDAALALADRWLLARSVRGTTEAVDGAFDPADALVIAEHRAAMADLARGRRALEPTGLETARELGARLDAARQRMEAARSRLAEVQNMPASRALRARLFAEPAPIDEVRAALAPGQGLMVALDLDPRRRLFLAVRGSTLAADPVVIDVRAPDGGLPPAAGVRQWVVADALLPAPLALSETPTARVSSPTALAAAAEQQRLGLDEVWALGPPSGAPGAKTLRPEEARVLAAPRVAAERPPEGALDARPATERLRGGAIDLFVIGADVELGERAGERGRVLLGAETLALASATRPANVLVIAAGSGTPAAALDLAMAVRGVASSIVIPADVPRAAASRVVSAVARDKDQLGLASALDRAVAAEVAGTPAAARIRLIGAPGLDPKGAELLAQRRQAPLRARTAALVKGGRFADAVPVAGEYVRALGVTGDTGAGLLGAHQLLVASLSRTEQWPRAAEAQTALVRFLETRATPELQKKNLVGARLEQAVILSRAGDVAASSAAFEALQAELEKAGDRKTLATVHARTAEAARSRLDFPAAARAYERAIATQQALGAYDAKEVPAEAQDLLRRAAALYLNQLSDSGRARALYLRAHQHAAKPELQAAILLDLARVARRRGEFEEAASRAEAARDAARAIKAAELALEALIEATNIAWYRGDLARGRSLCNEALSQADAQLKAARANRLTSARGAQTRMIYVLSACGLVDMSSGDFPSAERTLLSAVRLASAGGEAMEAEAAAQYNNLGRVYLEFGRLPRAVEAFQRAAEIDERRADRFGLAYDLRNLGTAQSAQGRRVEAIATLERALVLAREVQDDNNQLRALVVLADLAREAGHDAEAVERYRQALVIAERTDNVDLGGQIHRSLGLIHRARGELPAARAELEAAIAQARRLPGRAGATEFGPHRFAAFDDLVHLDLAQGDVESAFGAAERARAVAQLSLLDDERVARARPALARELALLRTITTATTADAIEARLRAEAPAVAARLAVPGAAAIARELPATAAIAVYRPTDDGLVVFVLAGGTVTATVVTVRADALGDVLRDYRRRLEARADMASAHATLSRWLIDPIRGRLEGIERLAIVARGGLRVVAFPALPFDGEAALVDRLTLIQAPDPRAAADALLDRPLSVTGRSLIALAAPEPDRGAEIPLAFAPRELEVIREAHPSAVGAEGPAATRSRLISGLGEGGAVVHFAGHSRLSIADPLASALITAESPLALHEVLASRTSAALSVLSACETLTAPDRALSAAAVARREPVSFADALLFSGSRAVLATPIRVDDVSAAMVMKRFYRSARSQPIPEALRDAQRAVRALDPHPAAWATFALTMSGDPQSSRAAGRPRRSAPISAAAFATTRTPHSR